MPNWVLPRKAVPSSLLGGTVKISVPPTWRPLAPAHRFLRLKARCWECRENARTEMRTDTYPLESRRYGRSLIRHKECHYRNMRYFACDSGGYNKNRVAMFAFVITEDKRLHFLFWRVSQTLDCGILPTTI